jgi:hypothetical protein
MGAKSHADESSGLAEPSLPRQKIRRHDRARDIHNNFEATLDHGEAVIHCALCDRNLGTLQRAIQDANSECRPSRWNESRARLARVGAWSRHAAATPSQRQTQSASGVSRVGNQVKNDDGHAVEELDSVLHR